MRSKLTMQGAKRHFETMATQAQAVLDDFKAKFDLNPIYALEWSDSAYVSAAQLEIGLRYQRVCDHYLELEDPDSKIGDLAKQLNEQMLFRVRQNMNHSTGQGQNLMDRSRGQVLAEVVEWFVQEMK